MAGLLRRRLTQPALQAESRGRDAHHVARNGQVEGRLKARVLPVFAEDPAWANFLAPDIPPPQLGVRAPHH